jgi:branched-chain amino acid transport system substrate-binding protein
LTVFAVNQREETMKVGMRITGGLCAAAIGLFSAGAAMAQENLRFGLCYDLSKAYTFVSLQIAQAAQDLAKLQNSKGGIEGRQIELILRDHGNEAQRGIECYEQLKREGVFVFDFMSTPVANALIPRTMKDGNIQIMALTGRGDAVDGSVFKTVYPLGATYWGQAANDIAYIKEQSGGKLEGVKVGFVYFDYPFGQEPIRVLQALAKLEGFELQLFPVPLPGTDQSAVWSQVRRANPDWILGWMFSNGQVVASREMRRNGIPLTKYLSSNWLNEVDLRAIGFEAAKGVKRGTNIAGGQDFPIKKEIIAELYERGLGSGDRELVDDVYYNAGLAVYSIVFEGVRLALKNHDGKFSAETMKAGLESITNFDAGGLIPPINITADDHGGGGKTRVEMWDGEKWIPQTDWISAYDDAIWDVVREYSSKFASENK